MVALILGEAYSLRVPTSESHAGLLNVSSWDGEFAIKT
jgi:hypothetical protein